MWFIIIITSGYGLVGMVCVGLMVGLDDLSGLFQPMIL